MKDYEYNKNFIIYDIHPSYLLNILKKIKKETNSAYRFYSNRTPIEYYEYQLKRENSVAYAQNTSLHISAPLNLLNGNMRYQIRFSYSDGKYTASKMPNNHKITGSMFLDIEFVFLKKSTKKKELKNDYV